MAERGGLGSRDPSRDMGVIKRFQPCPVRLEAADTRDRQRWLSLSLLGVPHTPKSLQGHQHWVPMATKCCLGLGGPGHGQVQAEPALRSLLHLLTWDGNLTA